MATVEYQPLEDIMGWSDFIRVGEHGITKPQMRFLVSTVPELLYGGAAGGGKSWCLLAGALQYEKVPKYSALLLRKTYSDLVKSGALMDRAREWLNGTSAVWEGAAHRWRFPSGASVEFGSLQNLGDETKYQSAEYQYIGVDEATQLPERQLRYMFSRLRKTSDIDVPLRMRYCTNPGGASHAYFKRRFVDPLTRDPRSTFIPARLKDNPYLDRAEYIKSLMVLDPITRLQLLNGDWSARTSGSFLKREWFEVVDAPPAGLFGHVRYWDLAASVNGKRTAGVLEARGHDGYIYILSVVKGRWTTGTRDRIILQTARADGHGTEVYVEQEPGSGGIKQVDSLVQDLAGFRVIGQPASGPKGIRAGPFASFAERGFIRLVNGPWVAEFLDEAEVFEPDENGRIDKAIFCDQIDAAGGAFSVVSQVRMPTPGGFGGQDRNRADSDDARDRELEIPMDSRKQDPYNDYGRHGAGWEDHGLR